MPSCNDGTRLVGDVSDPYGRSDKDWIQTFKGRQFWPLSPRPEEVFLDDVAHALAHQCRFTGHSRVFYSVAQHSVLVSLRAPAGEDPLWGLLHDAAEAYLVDVARPVKRSPELEGYRVAEKRLMYAICQRYALAWPEPAWVKQVDNAMLSTERRDIMAPPPKPWAPGPEPYLERIEPWGPEESERRFLERFRDLNDGEIRARLEQI